MIRTADVLGPGSAKENLEITAPSTVAYNLHDRNPCSLPARFEKFFAVRCTLLSQDMGEQKAPSSVLDRCRNTQIHHHQKHNFSNSCQIRLKHLLPHAIMRVCGCIAPFLHHLPEIYVVTSPHAYLINHFAPNILSSLLTHPQNIHNHLSPTLQLFYPTVFRFRFSEDYTVHAQIYLQSIHLSRFTAPPNTRKHLFPITRPPDLHFCSRNP